MPQFTFVLKSCWSRLLTLCACAQLSLTLCYPMDHILSGSSIHGISQARVLEWVAFSFSRGSSQPRDQTQVSCNAGRHFNLWAIREALCLLRPSQIPFPPYISIFLSLARGNLHMAQHSCRPWITILYWSRINPSLLEKYLANYFRSTFWWPMQGPGQLLGNLIKQFLGLFQNLLTNKIQARIQKSDGQLLMIITINFRMCFKEKSCLPSDDNFTWGDFNSVFINLLNWELSLLTKRTRIYWETMFISDLVNLASQLSHTPDEPPGKKPAKI